MQAEALWLYEWDGYGRYLKAGVSNMQNKLCETPMEQPIIQIKNVKEVCFILLNLFRFCP